MGVSLGRSRCRCTLKGNTNRYHENRPQLSPTNDGEKGLMTQRETSLDPDIQPFLYSYIRG